MARQSTICYFQDEKLDSKTEYLRIVYLWSLQEDGIICDLEFRKEHLKTILIPARKYLDYTGKKRTYAALTYTPDVSYHFADHWIIEDVKSAYGYSAKNVKKGIAGKPNIEPVSHVRARIYQIQYPNRYFRYVTIPTLLPDEWDRYFYIGQE